MVGLSKGGQSVSKTRESFSKTLDDLVQLASLQTSLKTLDEALKVTNRRVNALEFVIMPQLGNTIRYIMAELDELEREDQFRIKKVKDIMSKIEEDRLEAESKNRDAIEAEVQKKKREGGGDDGGEATTAAASSAASTKSAKKGKGGKGGNKSLLQDDQYAVDGMLE
jgi:V-type H+-transporting ATPase subunit D